jgi:hypothetical protein
MEEKQTNYMDPPTLEARSKAMTNSLPDLALQFHAHALRRQKQDIRWGDLVSVADRILRERGISWE